LSLEQIIQILKSEFPNKSIDLAESLDLLKEVINDTMNSISHKSNDAFVKRDFETRKRFDEIAQSVYYYEQKLDEVITLFCVDAVELLDDEDPDEETEMKKIPNYADYIVDNNVEHLLYENFTHKKPFAFCMNDEQKIMVRTWQEMLKKTVEILITINNEQFVAFEHAPGMNGKKVKYISCSSEGMRRPQSILDKVFLKLT